MTDDPTLRPTASAAPIPAGPANIPETLPANGARTEPERDWLPLSLAQQSVWLDAKLSANCAYQLGGWARVASDLDPAAEATLRQSIRMLMARHDGLRLRVDDDLPRQWIDRSTEPPLTVLDLPGVNPAEPADAERAFAAHLARAFAQPMPLGDQPLFRIELLRVPLLEDLNGAAPGSGRHYILWRFHHLIADSISVDITLSHWFQTYHALTNTDDTLAEASAGLPPASSYLPTIRADQAYLESAAYHRNLAYWVARFEPLPPPLIPDLIPDSIPEPSLIPDSSPDTSPQSIPAQIPSVAWTITGSRYADLERAAAEAGSTPSRALFALCALAAGRRWGQTDLVAGIALHRRDPTNRHTLGMMAGVIAVRCDFDPFWSLAGCVEAFSEQMDADLRHQRLPVDALARALGLSATGRRGLFEIAMSYMPAVREQGSLGFDLPVTTGVVQTREASPISLHVAELSGGRGLELCLAVNPDLLPGLHAAALALLLEVALDQFLRDPNACFEDLAALTAEERRLVLELWPRGPAAGVQAEAAGDAQAQAADRATADAAEGRAEAGYRFPEGTLDGLFSAQAARTPEAIALVDSDGATLSYARLEARSSALAHRLRARLRARSADLAEDRFTSGSEDRASEAGLDREPEAQLDRTARERDPGRDPGCDPGCDSGCAAAAPGVLPGRPQPVIGVRMERSAATVVALLAILKAGAVYLPLDPAYPEDRLRFMIEDAGAALVLNSLDNSPGDLHNLQNLGAPDDPHDIGDLNHLEQNHNYCAQRSESGCGRSLRNGRVSDCSSGYTYCDSAINDPHGCECVVNLNNSSQLHGHSVRAGRYSNCGQPERVDASDVISQPDTRDRNSRDAFEPCGSDRNLTPDPDRLAYIIYTSGTTGRPKGVEVSHRAAVHLAFARRAAHDPLGAGDRVLAAISVGFDVSLGQLLLPLLAGATVVIAPELRSLDPQAFWYLLDTHKITHINSVPSFFDAILSAAPPPPGLALKRLMLGGEPLSGALIRRIHTALPQVELINMYGPTEATIDATYHRTSAADYPLAVAPIGRPLPNYRAYILEIPGPGIEPEDTPDYDPGALPGGVGALRPVPPGVAGELYLGGPGLARGYRNATRLTAARFLPDPFAAPAAERAAAAGDRPRLYRTGDRARWRADGAIEFLGRNDTQVKIRGFRVEPAEIEALLLALPGIAQAVVVARSAQPATGAAAPGHSLRLVAFIVPRASHELPAPAALREHLAAHLPEYMVPSAFVLIDAIPLNRNGKLDPAALPSPELGPGEGEYLAPRTPIEQTVAALFAEVLGVERCGAADHFFALGGHSLLATRLAARLRSQGWTVPLRAIFEAPTVEQLARRIELSWSPESSEAPDTMARPHTEDRTANPSESPSENTAENASALRPGTANRLHPLPRPDDLPLSATQERIWFVDQLAQDSGYTIPIAFRLRGLLDRAAATRAIERIVLRHEALRTRIVVRDGRPVQQIQAAAALAAALADACVETSGAGRPLLPVISLASSTAAAHPGERAPESDPDGGREVELSAAQQASEPALQHALASQLARLAGRRFDLARELPFEFLLLELGAEDHVLAAAVHHAVFDGWSAGVFLAEFAALYTAFAQPGRTPAESTPAEPDPLPPLAIQYVDFALWQRSQDRSADLRFWLEELQGAPAYLELPPDPGAVPGEIQGAGPAAGLTPDQVRDAGTVAFTLAPELHRELLRLAAQQGASLFMLLHAAFALLLARWSGQHDLVLGTVVANRTRTEFEPLIGCFVNTLPLRTRFTAGESFTALLGRVKQADLAAFAHQDVPFDELARALAPQRSLEHTPIFQVMLVLQNAPLAAATLPGLSLEPVVIEAAAAKFDLTLTLTESAGTLAGAFEYRARRFTEPTIAALARRFEHLLATLVARPSLEALTVDMLTAEERRLVLELWPRGPAAGVQAEAAGDAQAQAADRATADAAEGRAEAGYRFPEGTLDGLFSAQAARTPEAIALVDSDGATLSYARLEARSSALAHRLRARLRARSADLAEDRFTSGSEDRASEAGLDREPEAQLDRTARERDPGRDPGCDPGCDSGCAAAAPGVLPGRPQPVIGVRMERSAATVVALLAILKAGAVYLPLDPAYPEDRLRFMIEDAGAALVLNSLDNSPGDLHNLQNLGAPDDPHDIGDLNHLEQNHNYCAQRSESGCGRSLRNGRVSDCSSGYTYCDSAINDPHGCECVVNLNNSSQLHGHSVRAGRYSNCGQPERVDASDVISQPDTRDRNSRDAFEPCGSDRNLTPDPDRLAYIIYTSGTTGRPKGVEVSHRAAVHLAFARRAAHDPLGAGDRVLAAISVGFDVSLGQLLLPLLAGATVVIAPELRSLDPQAFWYLLDTHKITHINSVPSFFDAILSAAPPPPGLALKRLMLGGEPLSGALIRRIHTALPQVELINMYGPTEATIDATYHRTSAADYPLAVAPIGRPLPNYRAYILEIPGPGIEPEDTPGYDPGALPGGVGALRPVPPGVAGELYLGGPGLARGYRNATRLTAARFLPDPFAAPAAERAAAAGDRPRLYRTGDRARWRADGAIEFLGRNDTQVKIRGFRVEPAEIEALLLALPGIREAVVVAQTGPAANPEAAPDAPTASGVRLIAYYTLFPAPVPEPRSPAAAATDSELTPDADHAALGIASELTPAALREALAAVLPDYMVPAAFLELAALPLTPNGKLDRAALPAPGEQAFAARAYEAPIGPVEQTIAALWADLLGIKRSAGQVEDPAADETTRIGRHDNFFSLGGHSLLAMRLVTALSTAFGVTVPVRTLFTHPTVEALARAIETPHLISHQGNLVPLRTAGSRTPLFVVHPSKGHVFRYLPLVRELGPDQPVYGLQASGLDDGNIPDETLEAMAATYVEAIRTTQAQGPYQLLGYSSGGLLAYEMAQQLRASGEQVGFLGLLDTALPDPSLPRTVTGEELLLEMAQSFGIADLAERAETIAELVTLARAAGRLPADLEAVHVERMAEVFRKTVRTCPEYRPRSWPGALLLIRATRRAEPMPDWTKLVTGPLAAIDLDCDHDSLMSAELAPAVADAVRSRLA